MKIIKSEDIVGKKFGRLTILSTFIKKGLYCTRRYVTCKCDCGNEITTRYDAISSGHTVSCGCYHLEKVLAQAKQAKIKRQKGEQ